jgi:hypothetical protein
MTETKLCEWCSQPYERGKVTPAKWGRRRCCSVPHSSKLIAHERTLRQRVLREVGESLGVDGWAGIVFPTADPGDGGFIKLMRAGTHVHYETSASWGAI